MGIATIVASIVYGANSDSGNFSDRLIRDAMMYVGVDMIRAGQVRKQEKQLHTQTLEELSSSFDDDVEPMVIEIQGTQHRLTGTADAQYEEWRELLRQIFITESGFVPEDVAIYTEPTPEAPVELPLFAEPQPEAAAALATALEVAPAAASDPASLPAPAAEGGVPASESAAPASEPKPAAVAAPDAGVPATEPAADASASANDGV
jgi:hypothetical protein